MFSRLYTVWFLAFITLLIFCSLLSLLLWKNAPAQSPPIVLYCAEAMRELIQDVVPHYEKKTGQIIEVRFGTSQEGLTGLRITNQGDLFLPADDSYIEDALRAGLVDDIFFLGEMKAVLVVHKDYEEDIRTWHDLIAKHPRLTVANPESAAISRSCRAHLGQNLWNQLHQNALELGSVTHVANAINQRLNVDAGLIWDNMLVHSHYHNLRPVALPELEGVRASVRIGCVRGSDRHEPAVAFAHYLTGPENAAKRRSFGFSTFTPASTIGATPK